MSIFVSHNSKDKELADHLIQLLRNALPIQSDDIRYTSAPGYGLMPGDPILETLRKEVLEATVVIGLLTPNSLNSLYVIFELGARWGSEQRIFPLCAQGVTPHNLPEPLKSLAALDCSCKVQLHQLVEDVAKELGKRTDRASAFTQQIDQLADAASAAANSGNHIEDVQDDSSRRVASHGEIVGTSTAKLLQLDLEWADIGNHTVLLSPCTVNSLMLEPLLPVETFDQPPPRAGGLYNTVLSYSLLNSPNPDYSAELIAFAYASAFVQPLGLRLHNNGKVFGRSVRFEGSLKKSDGMCVLDETVSFPSKTLDSSLNINYSSAFHVDQAPIDLEDSKNSYEITVEFGDIRPDEEIWTSNTLWFGSLNAGIVSLEGKLLGENISEPIQCSLDIRFETECRPMQKEDVHSYRRAHLDALGLEDI